MELQDVLHRLDEERRSLQRHGEILDILPNVTRSRAVDRSHHSVSFSSVDAFTADAAIQQEIEHHRALGVSFEWKLYAHDAPGDMLERLKRHGLQIGACEPVMVVNLSSSADWIDA